MKVYVEYELTKEVEGLMRGNHLVRACKFIRQNSSGRLSLKSSKEVVEAISAKNFSVLEGYVIVTVPSVPVFVDRHSNWRKHDRNKEV